MAEVFEAVIGLEVHIQLKTRSKMFCSCPAEYGAEPNSLTCPVCLGLPGALPALNTEAVRMALALGLALEAQIQPSSLFYRKQYFYPDLPKGYQITQGPVALVENGRLAIPGDPAVRGQEGTIQAGIERAHLEEDAGKSLHDGSEQGTLVDLNRAGVPLLEIVGRPDLRSPQEASDYLKTLHRLVTFLGICDGNMEEGSFRCDANVSLRAAGAEAYGTRAEIKNLNSFSNVRRALEFEIGRHRDLLQRGETLVQETRGWDADRGETRSQRSKEAAMDYRYFPEPDLPPLTVTAEEIETVRRGLPELPEARRARLVQTYGLTDYEAGMLLQNRAFGDFFEAAARVNGQGKQAANWMLGEVSRTLNDTGQELAALSLSPMDLAELIALVDAGTVNLNTAKAVLYPALLKGEGRPGDLVAALGLAQVSDKGAIAELVRQVLSAHPGQVAELQAGREALRGFLVGQVMKAGKGKVNPVLVNEILAEELALGRQ
jgi:aspartyl-tRNA(Asn)/glutamyl-tRNA(Gln) amidotransferase subunit B